MANLKESPVWEEGIRQLETSDPVMGGEDGVDNIQGKQLANRTQYLKKFKANIESPEFTGEPKAPTPSQSVDDGTIATTAFVKVVVKAAIAELVGNAPDALNTLAELAKALGDDKNLKATLLSEIAKKLSTSGGKMTGTLQGKSGELTKSNSHNVGFTFSDDNDSGLASPRDGLIALVANGISALEINTDGLFGKVPFYGKSNSSIGIGFDGDKDTGFCNPQDGKLNTKVNGVVIEETTNTYKHIHVGDYTYTFQADGNFVVHKGTKVIFDSYNQNFSGSIADNGWVKLPNGLIFQWGVGSASNGNTNVFPISFPNRCFQIVASDIGSGCCTIGIAANDNNGWRAWAKNDQGNYAPAGFRYWAVGH